MHYERVEDVDLRHRFDGDGIARTNEEWDIIHEAFRQMRVRKDAKSKKERKRPVHHHYKQSGTLF